MKTASLCRYPIKSHGRETLDQVTLIQGQTMPWDRTWAVTHEATKVDTAAPEWASCHNFVIGTRNPALAGFTAELDEATRQTTLHHPALGTLRFCPDDADDIARFLSWSAPLTAEGRAGATGIISAAARGMTDTDYPSISIMTTASHRAVEQAIGGPLETERWRGNIWLDGTTPWQEFDWIGRDIRIGATVLRLREPIKRCAHTTANPTTGRRDADTLGTLERSFGHQNFGVYAEVIQGGTIHTGDEATLL